MLKKHTFEQRMAGTVRWYLDHREWVEYAMKAWRIHISHKDAQVTFASIDRSSE